MKAMKFVASILEGLASASVTLQTENAVQNTAHDISYGDVVEAVMTNNMIGSFWKTTMLDVIPKDRDASEYKAAIAIINDKTLIDYFKTESLKKVFKRP